VKVGEYILKAMKRVWGFEQAGIHFYLRNYWTGPAYSFLFGRFFMGVPVFNLAVGTLAGVFMGRSFYHEGMAEEQLQKASASLAHFSALVMALVAIASAYLATKDIPDTALNLRGMLKLPFLPTR
jgi:Leu/Phe-tRNA-protein transferase